MSERFQIVEINPNDVTGGGGCLCAETKVADCKPPYVVWPHQEMENNLSPHAVVCASCISAAADAVAIGAPLAGGESGATVIELDADDVVEVSEAAPVEEDDEEIPAV